MQLRATLVQQIAVILSYNQTFYKNTHWKQATPGQKPDITQINGYFCLSFIQNKIQKSEKWNFSHNFTFISTMSIAHHTNQGN